MTILPNNSEVCVLSADRLTIKATEALQASASEAQRRDNPAIEDLHLLAALLAQDETVVVPVLQKVGVNVTRLREDLNAALDRLPRQSGGSAPSLSRELNKVLDAADKEARSLKDEYVSTEHLLIALAAQKGSSTRALGKRASNSRAASACSAAG